MISRIISLTISLAALPVLSSCATPAKIVPYFNQDGRVAYAATCRSDDWASCLQLAGKVCLDHGYTVIHGPMAYDGDQRQLAVLCKKGKN